MQLLREPQAIDASQDCSRRDSHASKQFLNTFPFNASVHFDFFLAMWYLEFLLLYGSAYRLIKANEAPRPRGVGPDCT